jgi:regulator of protease activity HflC (stomatin/prohibitin superfamily)
MSIIHPQVRGGHRAEWKGGDMGVPATACIAAWSAAVGLGFALKGSPFLPWVVSAGGLLGLYLLFAIKVARQWEKAVVLRIGRFVGLRGPGVFFIVPVFESVREMVDQRVRVTSVSAESALTRDTVPVNVDAIVFWLVWDAEKVIFEVQEYFDAVTLSAQTALRESIGRHMLAEMITDRETLGHQLQKILDEKTNGWGVTVQSVEIRDVRLPAGLEDAMSRQAQAERERQARVILGTAETEIALKFAEASNAYRDNPAALQLRAMNMLYEAMKERGSMVIIPSSVVETMGGSGSIALASLGGARPGEPPAIAPK